jgi:hypothetical protein
LASQRSDVQVYKLLLDLTDGTNWSVEFHASI